MLTFTSKEDKILNLAQLDVGQEGKIVSVSGNMPLRRRLLDMGLTPGTHVKVLKFAPFGDPIVIRLRGYDLSLRKQDAKMIKLEEKD